MQEKVLSSKKNGMAMMILFILLYVAATALAIIGSTFLSLYSNGCGRIHLVIFGMDSISWIKSTEASGSSGSYLVW